MKKLCNISYIILIINLLFLTGTAQAQRRGSLDGSGIVVEKQLDLPMITEVVFKNSMPGDFIITTQASKSELTMTIDDNLEELLEIDIKGGQLSIGLKGNENNRLWVERTNIRVYVYLPTVANIKFGGNGHLTVEQLDQHDFSLQHSGNGSAKLTGKVEDLHISSKGNGSVNAKGLLAIKAKASSAGNGSIWVNASQAQLSSTGNGNAVNTQDKNTKTVDKELVYVSLKLYNNKATRKGFTVKGPNPNGSRYSYGFSINPFGKKQERFSVGSKIKIGTKVLHTVTAEDEGQVITLFN